MEPQNNTKLVIVLLVLLTLAIAAGVYYSWPSSDIPVVITPPVTEEPRAIDIATKTILVTHNYLNGEHIYEGRLDLQTPCDSIDYDAKIEETFPEKVLVSMRTVKSKQVCAQVITEKPFTVKYKAGPTAVGENLSVTLDGKPILFIVGEKG